MEAYRRSWLDMAPIQRRMILLLAGAVLLANVRQPYPDVAPLHHVPTLLLVLGAAPLLRRWPMSDRAVAALVGFFLLHTLAARYTYSNVPYDAWARALTGHELSDVLGVRRNDFDRVVHLSFGLLSLVPAAEAMRRHLALSSRLATCVAFLFVGWASAFYEILEWGLFLLGSPGLADDYSGQQGDLWDPQKDMALAMAGASMAVAALALRRLPRRQRGACTPRAIEARRPTS